MGPGYFPLVARRVPGPARRASSSSKGFLAGEDERDRRRSRGEALVLIVGAIICSGSPCAAWAWSPSLFVTALVSRFASRATSVAAACDRRRAHGRLRRSIFVVALSCGCRSSAPGSGSRDAMDLSATSPRLRDGADPGEPALLLRRRAPRHAGRGPARHRADRDDRDAAADHVQLRAGVGADHAGRASTTARSTAAPRRRS